MKYIFFLGTTFPSTHLSTSLDYTLTFEGTPSKNRAILYQREAVNDILKN